MGIINIDQWNYSFRVGAYPDGTILDAAFSEVATKVASLDRDNFRKTAGFRNENKSSPYSLLVLTTTIPSFTYTDTSGQFFVNLFAYPHSTNVNYSTTSYAPALKQEQLVEPFKLVGGQVVYDNISGHDSGDLISMVTKYVPLETKNTNSWTSCSAVAGTISSYAADTIHSATYSLVEASACVVQMQVIPNGSTVGTRTVTNWTGTIQLLVKHVA